MHVFIFSGLFNQATINMQDLTIVTVSSFCQKEKESWQCGFAFLKIMKEKQPPETRPRAQEEKLSDPCLTTGNLTGAQQGSPQQPPLPPADLWTFQEGASGAPDMSSGAQLQLKPFRRNPSFSLYVLKETSPSSTLSAGTDVDADAHTRH